MKESTGQRRDPKRLKGIRVMVTRPRDQQTALAEGLRSLGAEVVEAPVIRIDPPLDMAPLDRAIQRLGEYDWIVFTSANGVRSLHSRMRALGTELREMGRAKLAAIGPATASTLEAAGLPVDVVPDRFIAEEVFAALERSGPLRGCRVLLPRADIARQALPNLLKEAGAEVDVVVAYRTVSVSEELASAMRWISQGKIDVVTFTSGSTVRSFVSGIKEDAQLRGKFVSASIGPITSQALREAGLEPVIEATVYSVDGLIEAIERYFTDEPKSVGRGTA